MSNAKDYLPEIPKDPSAAAPSSSRRFTRGASDKGEQQSSQRQKDKQRQQQQNTGYVDVIDKLDFSGLNMSFHHSGPFDAAVSRTKSRKDRPDPIGAFSQSALDPSAGAVSPNGADLAPLRDSYIPGGQQRGAGGSGNLSARARAALTAMDGHGQSSSSGGAFDESSENLLGSPGGRRTRRTSDSSITLGYPGGAAKSEKERQYLEAFGVHGEAYEDYGNSRYARQAPRASVVPSRNTSYGTPGADDGGIAKPASRAGLKADRTASIWDIEATLREGRPVGAQTPLPPMPVLPQQFANGTPTFSPSSSQGSSSGNAPVKRSKSLISRMRSKKTPISSPRQANANSSADASDLGSPYEEKFASSPGQAPAAPTLSYSHSQDAGPDLQYGGDSPASEKAPTHYLDARAATVVGGGGGGDRPGMGGRRATNASGSSSGGNASSGSYAASTRPARGQAQRLPSSDLLNVRAAPRYGASSVSGSNGRTASPREPPSPASPLGLPEADEYFPHQGNGSGSGKRGILSSSSASTAHRGNTAKYDDALANESATAAILAESSSKESNLTSSSSGGGVGGISNDTSFASSGTGVSTLSGAGTAYGNGNGNGSGNGYGSANTSGGSPAATQDDENWGDRSADSPSTSKISRKPSLVGRFFRGGAKKNPT